MSGNKEGGIKSAHIAKRLYGKDYHKKLGSLGGKASDSNKSVATIKEKYGEDHYVKAGLKSAEKAKEKRSV